MGPCIRKCHFEVSKDVADLFQKEFYDMKQIEDYDKWFAAYSDRFYYPYAYKIWQYSQNGTVQGINGDVDLNISFGPPWEE